MSYAIIVIIGLITAVLLFALFRNEARVQNRQVKSAFGNLILEVHCNPDEETSPSPLAHLGREKQVITYPIVSTSITCGRKSEKSRRQVDLAIPTGDTSLKETAAEFTVEPDSTSLRLYVRRLEQPLIWTCSRDRSVVQGVIDEAALRWDDKTEGPVVPSLPRIFYSKKQEEPLLYKGEKKLPLQLGDKILLGNTLIVVGRDGEERT